MYPNNKDRRGETKKKRIRNKNKKIQIKCEELKAKKLNG